MTQQQPLVHIPGRGGIWRRFLLPGTRAINAAPWLDAIARHEPVGTCPGCAGHLFPAGHPNRIGGRDSYPVECATCHAQSAALGPAQRKKRTRTR